VSTNTTQHNSVLNHPQTTKFIVHEIKWFHSNNLISVKNGLDIKPYIVPVLAGSLERLLQLPLSGEEEAALVEQLLSSVEPRAQELLVLHFLQRARFLDAITLNEKLKHTNMVRLILGLWF